MNKQTPPEKYQLTFLRHGESVGNANSYHQGQADFPLTDKGKKQISCLASRWKREKKSFDTIIASPLSRAIDTAEIISKALDIGIVTDPVWMERDNGVLAGLTHQDARSRYPRPNFISPYHKIGITGETPWETYLRAGRALQSILHKKPGTYLIVSHGGLLNSVVHAIIGIAPHPNEYGPRFLFANGAFSTFEYYPHAHKWLVISLNDTAHLDCASETAT